MNIVQPKFSWIDPHFWSELSQAQCTIWILKTNALATCVILRLDLVATKYNKLCLTCKSMKKPKVIRTKPTSLSKLSVFGSRDNFSLVIKMCIELTIKWTMTMKKGADLTTFRLEKRCRFENFLSSAKKVQIWRKKGKDLTMSPWLRCHHHHLCPLSIPLSIYKYSWNSRRQAP